MSIHVIDRRARYYPISIAQEQPISQAARHNIQNISDASIALQPIDQDIITAYTDIVVKIQVAQSRILLQCSCQNKRIASYELDYVEAADAYISADRCCRVYVQPGHKLIADNTTWLRLNASCITIYPMPATLCIATRLPGLEPEIYANQQHVKHNIQQLKFAQSGYNTAMSYSQGQLTIAGTPGLGLGMHPVDRTIYTDAQLEAIADTTNPIPGLLSINGHSGNLSIKGNGTLQVQSTVAAQSTAINLRLTRSVLPADEQNN